MPFTSAGSRSEMSKAWISEATSTRRYGDILCIGTSSEIRCPQKVEQHIVAMDEGIGKLRDLLAKVLGVRRHCLMSTVGRYSNENQSYIKKCVGPGILRGNLDPVHFHPYRANAAMEEIHKRPDSRQLHWAYPLLRKVGALARAMGYLVRKTALPEPNSDRLRS